MIKSSILYQEHFKIPTSPKFDKKVEKVKAKYKTLKISRFLIMNTI